MKNMRKGSGLVLGLLWFLMADLATAGDYVMVVGKGFEVCEAYFKNLNSFPSHPPMVCERPLNHKFTEFSKPVWQPVDILQNFDLLRQVEQTLRGMTDEQWDRQSKQWEVKIQERVTNGWLSMSTTELDVDRDGNIERVLRYVNDPGGCDPKNQATYSHPSGTEFYVLTPDQKRIDVQKSQMAFPGYGGRPEVFIYGGQWYLTTWAGGPRFEGGQLSIHSVELTPRRPCQFTYAQSAKGRPQ